MDHDTDRCTSSTTKLFIGLTFAVLSIVRAVGVLAGPNGTGGMETNARPTCADSLGVFGDELVNPAPGKIRLPRQNEAAAFAHAALENTYDLPHVGNGAPEFRERALHSLELEFQARVELNGRNVLEQRLAFSKCRQADADDLREVVYEEHGRTALSGIRWFGGDLTRPFVDLWPAFPVDNAETLAAIAWPILDHFSKFNVEELLLWSRPGLWSHPEVEPDRLDHRIHREFGVRVIAGWIEQLIAEPASAKAQRVAFAPPSSDTYFEWYEGIYSELHRARPELRYRVPMSEREELESCRAAGLLQEIWIDGTRAGLIAADSSEYLGQPAIYFHEFVLDAPWRGQGWGPVAQRAFLAETRHDPNRREVIAWGTIDAQNPASLRTAMRVGRVPVREEVFIRFDRQSREA